jgi:sporulation protein YlmC with PRC-barrel domain
MKRLSIFTIILFALGLYMVPATFAGGPYSESKDKQPGQGEYQTDQNRPAQTQLGIQGQQAQQSQQLQQQRQNLLLVDNLIGTEIQNQQGEKIGQIDSVLVDVENGRIGFVTMTSGGVFGMGQDKYIVPFNALQKKMPQGTQAQVSERQQRQVVFTLNKEKDQLKAVPEGDIEEVLTRQNQSREIHEHYGVSPYWEEGQLQQQRQDDTQRQMMQDTKKDPMMDKKDRKK